MLLVAGLPLYCTVPRQLRKYAQLTRAMHPNTLFVRPVFNRSRPDGSSALACRVVPRRLSYSDVGTRFIVADSIRNLGQEERAVVMPHRMIDAKPARMLDAGHRNPLTNDFT